MKDSTASITAKICAYTRAPSNDSKAVFNDYLAPALLTSHDHRDIERILKGRAQGGAGAAFASVPLTRSAWAEGHLTCFAAGRERVQYVILGAGLDTFAWRNRDPRIRVFEVDHPDTQREKRSRIASLSWQSASAVTFTGVDFNRDSLASRLLESGFDPRYPSFFTILGVAYYLPFEAFSRTVSEISKIAGAHSRLLFDFQIAGYERMRTARELSDFTAELGEEMARGYTVSEVEALLFEQGWSFSEHLTPSAIDERYFRHSSAAMRAFDSVHFMAASR
jgi:methyltransferase (TIGR00027 family)